ncbi:MAG: hypothetical protein MK085_07335 [Phycisphaerales bacterium]|nr:hypothetical protein [Phycisphaerales bacterium]
MAKFNVRCQNGQTYNSLTAEQLKTLAANGMISVQDEVNPEGSDKWTVAGTIKGLFPKAVPSDAQAPTPSPPPAPASASGAVSPPLMTPPAEVAGVGGGNPDPNQQEEDDSDAPSGPGGVALNVIGYAFIALGIADFILYNLDIWDFYAGFNLAGSWIETYTAIIAGVVGGLLIGAGNRSLNLPAAAQWVLFAIASLFLLIILSASVGSSGFGSLDSVRYGTLYDCPERTLDEMAIAAMSYPEWESLLADDGYYYVNLTGGITWDSVPVQALLQFRVDEGDGFSYYACEINGVPQNDFVANELLDLLCRSR